MKKLAILMTAGIITMAVIVSAAGRAFDSFADSVDTSNGVAGCVSVSDK